MGLYRFSVLCHRDWMIIEIILLLIAAVAKAIMDALQFNSLLNRSPYWNPTVSWRNKYKFYTGNAATSEPAFFGSTTFFVFLTDGWHLMQFIFLNSLFALMILHKQRFGLIIDFIAMRVIFGVIFEITYRSLK